MGKYVIWKMQAGGILDWRLDDGKIAADQLLDGCYVIKTNVSEEVMNKDQTVARYKSLSQVEQAFRNLKTVSLEMRPMYHKTDDRIRSHVFLCMLAYYLQWHLTRRLAPVLGEQRDELAAGSMQPRHRRWTLHNVIEILKAQRRETVSLCGATFDQINDPTADQARLLKLLQTPPEPENLPAPAM